MTPVPRRLLPLLIVLATALALTGCGSGDDTGNDNGGSQSPKRVSVTIRGDSVTPHAQEVDVSVGQPIELDVTSDRDGELHVHSSPEHEFEVTPGHNTFKFTLKQPGVVDVEEHVSESLVLRVTVK